MNEATRTTPRSIHDLINASPEWSAQESEALGALLALGVKMGHSEEVSAEQRNKGHFGCTYHIVRGGVVLEGGDAAALLSYFNDGHLGANAASLTLVAQVDA